ncbi:MAG: HAMP domain-containing histidine kinase [Rhodospirillaceae bacterium]|nr:HAMP domain-containing histidine kinase [Rhodospirillaceae bacterium]
MTALSFKSLRFRFLFGAFLWVSIATLVAGFVISGLYRAHLSRNFHDELETHLIELVRLTETDADGKPALNRPLSDPRFQDIGSGFYWQIERAGYETVASATLGDRRLTGDFAHGQKEQAEWVPGPHGEVMECGISAPSRDGGPPLRFSIAVERRVLEETLAGFNADLGKSLLVFAALMVVGAMLQVQFGLRPAQRIADNIASLHHGKATRLPEDVPVEFGPIVTRLNTLLDAQSALVQRARVEAGNLGHGLRTPLALIGDEASQLERRGQGEAAQFILAQCRKIRRQIDYHMTRASAAGKRVTGYVADIAALMQQIVGAMQRLHADRNLIFVVDIPPGAKVNCDEADLAEILSNLVDNACKWAARRVTVSARTESGGRAVIEVLDDGPGIAAEMRAEVFDVGARLDESKAGSGLGLAISRDLARLSGGDLELLDGPSGGLLARLTLPGSVTP